jgi:hypothetical protein
MTALFIAVLASLRASIHSRLELAAEILALRTPTRRAATDRPETTAPSSD